MIILLFSQTLSRVGVALDHSQCFSHGQLYVALSRARDAESVKVATLRPDRRVKNPIIPAMIDEEDFNEIGPMELAISSGEEPVIVERIPHQQVIYFTLTR